MRGGFYGSRNHRERGSIGGVNLRGDLLAAWMTIALAILLVIYRRYPETPAAGPAVLSSLVLLPFAYALGVPFFNPPLEIAIMALFGLVLLSHPSPWARAQNVFPRAKLPCSAFWKCLLHRCLPGSSSLNCPR